MTAPTPPAVSETRARIKTMARYVLAAIIATFVLVLLMIATNFGARAIFDAGYGYPLLALVVLVTIAVLAREFAKEPFA